MRKLRSASRKWRQFLPAIETGDESRHYLSDFVSISGEIRYLTTALNLRETDAPYRLSLADVALSIGRLHSSAPTAFVQRVETEFKSDVRGFEYVVENDLSAEAVGHSEFPTGDRFEFEYYIF